ncbi:hypothetical protein C0J52_27634 [Blattella germanica]|nr:hypothetical protein C0J52_27634 [Blattella germanica]
MFVFRYLICLLLAPVNIILMPICLLVVTASISKSFISSHNSYDANAKSIVLDPLLLVYVKNPVIFLP